MADKEPEVLFEIDAAKILAKLHLAGLQPCTYDQNKEFIVNTGIKNDDPKAKPENPGKVEFDLGNSQGEYELGFVTSVTYKFHQQSKVRSTLSKIDNLASELAVAEKDKEKKPILVKQEEEDDKKKQEIKDILDDPAVQDVLKKSGTICSLINNVYETHIRFQHYRKSVNWRSNQRRFLRRLR